MSLMQGSGFAFEVKDGIVLVEAEMSDFLEVARFQSTVTSNITIKGRLLNLVWRTLGHCRL